MCDCSTSTMVMMVQCMSLNRKAYTLHLQVTFTVHELHMHDMHFACIVSLHYYTNYCTSISSSYAHL